MGGEGEREGMRERRERRTEGRGGEEKERVKRRETAAGARMDHFCSFFFPPHLHPTSCFKSLALSRFRIKEYSVLSLIPVQTYSGNTGGTADQLITQLLALCKEGTAETPHAAAVQGILNGHITWSMPVHWVHIHYHLCPHISYTLITHLLAQSFKRVLVQVLSYWKGGVSSILLSFQSSSNAVKCKCNWYCIWDPLFLKHWQLCTALYKMCLEGRRGK